MSLDTVASTLSTIDELILQAFKRAGLIHYSFAIGGDSDWTAKASYGRDTLNRIINNLSVHGFLEYFVGFYVLDLTSGTSAYVIDPDENILNIFDNGSYIPEHNDPEEIETSGETTVIPITRHRWNQMAVKEAEGTPTMYYLQRTAGTLTVRLWPIPSEDGKIRFQTHRIPFSSSTGSNNADLQRHWDTWIVNALAFEFMTDAKLPIDEREAVRLERDNQLAYLKAYETSNLPPDVTFCHSSPWSGFRL